MSMASSLGAAQDTTNCGLHHLVEAATALTQLVSSVPQVKPARTHTISDDEDTVRRAQLASQQFTGCAIPIAPNGAPPLSALRAAERKPSVTSCPREIFPQRLMRILSDHTISDIITWLPHGRSFVIIQQEVLAEKILPRYFPESTSASSNNKSSSAACKYPSFTRKLNRWGFRQVTRGPDAGAFHHKFFRRDEPRLCLQMICQRSRRRKGDEKKDVVSILPKAMGHYPLVSQSPLTENDPLSSASKVSSTDSFASISSSGQGQNASLRTKSPTQNPSIPVVSTTTSPTPRPEQSRPQHREQPILLVANSSNQIAQKDIKYPLSLNGPVNHSLPLSLAMGGTAPLKQAPPAVAQFIQQPPQITPMLKHQLTTSTPASLQLNVNATLKNNSLSSSNFAQPQQRQVLPLTAPVKTSPTAGKGATLSKEEVRIANAKSMLYNAYLNALG